MADDLTDTIATEAQKPKSVTVDGQSATARDIDELIKADRYAKAESAASAGVLGGIKMRKIKFPSAL